MKKSLQELKTGLYLHSQLCNGLVVQLVRIPACHAGGREFESRPDRKIVKSFHHKWELFLRSCVVNTEFKYLVFNRLYVFQPMRSFSCFKERLFLFIVGSLRFTVFSGQCTVDSIQRSVFSEQLAVFVRS